MYTFGEKIKIAYLLHSFIVLCQSVTEQVIPDQFIIVKSRLCQPTAVRMPMWSVLWMIWKLFLFFIPSHGDCISKGSNMQYNSIERLLILSKYEESVLFYVALSFLNVYQVIIVNFALHPCMFQDGEVEKRFQLESQTSYQYFNQRIQGLEGSQLRCLCSLYVKILLMVLFINDSISCVKITMLFEGFVLLLSLFNCYFFNCLF